LKLRQLPHLSNGFFRLFLELPRVDGVGPLVLETRAFHAGHNALGVLVFLFLNVLLHQFGVEALQTVRLHLEPIVEVCQVLNIVVDSLRSLLLLGQRHLQNLPIHSRSIVVCVAHLLLHNQGHRFQRTVQWHVYWVLYVLERVLFEVICLCETWGFSSLRGLLPAHLLHPQLVLDLICVFVRLHIVFKLFFGAFVGSI
jgi:hypothetical protein